MLRDILVWLAAAITATTPGIAADVYVVQGQATGPAIDFCNVYKWGGDVLFHNSTQSTQTVTLIGISNGPFPSTAEPTLIVPARKTVSAGAQGRQWLPLPTTANPLWVTHLDVPDGVVVESRIEIGISSCLTVPPNPLPIFGKVSFPVYRGLQPAGVPKVHLGTDLGGMDARNNVGIFNSGTTTANAHIELRQACDDAILGSLDVTLPANTTRQFTLPSVKTSCGESATATKPWVTYVMLTVDQPSISFVSILSNATALTVPYGVAFSTP